MMGHLAKLLLLSGLVTIAAAAEQAPELELLLFLAEFTDEAGNWDAPDLDEASMTTEEKWSLGVNDGE
jgi:hypothetical protein